MQVKTGTVKAFPNWLMLHVPHDSNDIPAHVRDQFVVSDHELQSELIKMTDHFTFDLFAIDVPDQQVVRAPVSRLVVDVERFEDDALEEMAQRGMGVIYRSGSQKQQIRREISPSERQELIDTYYSPHHQLLTVLVGRQLAKYGRAFVLDCHSFPNEPLPYEEDISGQNRADICLGTDDFHTSKIIVEIAQAEFTKLGFSVSINTPFSGSLVPQKHYQRDARVSSLMIEVNRRLYLNEGNGSKNKDFGSVQAQLREVLSTVLFQVQTDR